MSTATLPPVPGSSPGPGLPKEIPPELNRWNWGAFLLNWIWGLGNNTFLALLMFVPFVGLVMPFVLGAKGSAWAWKNGNWTSVEHFKRVQRRWAIWGVVALVVSGLLLVALFVGVSAALTGSQPYKIGVAKLQESPQVIERLGSPIATGNASGSIHTSDREGDADLSFTATGPKGSGDVTLKAIRSGEAWRLTALRLKPNGPGETIDVVRPEPRLTDFRFKTSADGEAKTTFKVGEKSILIQFNQTDVPVGTTFVADWVKLKDAPDGEDERFQQVTTELDDAEKNLVAFTLTFKNGWPAGRYRVDVSGQGIPSKSASFTVAE